MINSLDMQQKLLRRAGMKCERCGAEIGFNDSELCKTDPNGKFKEDSLHIYCTKCPQRYWQDIREGYIPWPPRQELTDHTTMFCVTCAFNRAKSEGRDRAPRSKPILFIENRNQHISHESRGLQSIPATELHFREVTSLTTAVRDHILELG